MAEDKEAFLSRWSRLKREQAAVPAPKEAETPAPALPPVEKLTPQSDFSDFMHPKVKEELRRLALKKLFTDPHFNIPDPFEPYSRDFTIGEPIPPEMLAGLNQSRTVLFREEEEAKEQEKKRREAQENEAQENKSPAEPQVADAAQGDTKQDEPGRKET